MIGLEIITELVQAPLVAVIVTEEPMAIAVMEFPEIVPAFELITAPALADTETLYVPDPEQTPEPALIVGVVHPTGGLLQLDGDKTVLWVLAHPLIVVEVITKLVPTGIPVIVLLIIVPEETEITPFVLKLTLYVAPLHTAPDTIKFGAVADGEIKLTISEIHPVAVEVIVTLVPIGTFVISLAETKPAEAEMLELLGLIIETLYVDPKQDPIL